MFKNKDIRLILMVEVFLVILVLIEHEVEDADGVDSLQL
jgi:hypothetical protein